MFRLDRFNLGCLCFLKSLDGGYRILRGDFQFLRDL